MRDSVHELYIRCAYFFLPYVKCPWPYFHGAETGVKFVGCNYMYILYANNNWYDLFWGVQVIWYMTWSSDYYSINKWKYFDSILLLPVLHINFVSVKKMSVLEDECRLPKQCPLSSRRLTQYWQSSMGFVQTNNFEINKVEIFISDCFKCIWIQNDQKRNQILLESNYIWWHGQIL